MQEVQSGAGCSTTSGAKTVQRCSTSSGARGASIFLIQKVQGV